MLPARRTMPAAKPECALPVREIMTASRIGFASRILLFFSDRRVAVMFRSFEASTVACVPATGVSAARKLACRAPSGQPQRSV
ncbi:MAG: hypothetical protein AW10_00136 [Candidatus Accumulibacter appositus]|uniref:Uncharacterized protein n=1 Tax=Candidatus Accumulibacter appositus TaxID=1454003 RepID=A0A011P659_9PROT|nr:MAG: hypothetical protein AW10_00136 [Candidatus Accumulibacter appositus]